MMQQRQNKLQTPLEKLISDKEHIRKQCVIQEQKLNDDLFYIQENAGSLLISGFTTLLFPNTKTKKTESTDPSASATSPAQAAIPIGFSDYLSIAQGLLPLLGCSKTTLAYLGIRKAQKCYRPLFKKKKKP